MINNNGLVGIRLTFLIQKGFSLFCDLIRSFFSLKIIVLVFLLFFSSIKQTYALAGLDYIHPAVFARSTISSSEIHYKAIANYSGTLTFIYPYDYPSDFTFYYYINGQWRTAEGYSEFGDGCGGDYCFKHSFYNISFPLGDTCIVVSARYSGPNPYIPPTFSKNYIIKAYNQEAYSGSPMGTEINLTYPDTYISPNISASSGNMIHGATWTQTKLESNPLMTNNYDFYMYSGYYDINPSNYSSGWNHVFSDPTAHNESIGLSNETNHLNWSITPRSEATISVQLDDFKLFTRPNQSYTYSCPAPYPFFIRPSPSIKSKPPPLPPIISPTLNTVQKQNLQPFINQPKIYFKKSPTQ